MSGIKISILIPVFNAEQYLKRCIDSCISQNYKNKQIVIINDGSTDRSEEIITAYYDSFPELIIVLSRKNSGPAAARKAGLKVSEGEFIFFLDADDYLAEDAISNLAACQRTSGSDVVVGQYNLVVESIIKQPNSFAVIEQPLGAIKAFLTRKLPITLWPTLYRKSIFENIRFYDFIVGEDFVINCQIYSIPGIKVSTIQSTVYYYVKHFESLTNSNNKYKTEQGYRAYEQGLELISNSYNSKEVELELCINMMNTLYALMILNSPNIQSFALRIKLFNTGILQRSLSSLSLKKRVIVGLLVQYKMPLSLIRFLINKVLLKLV